MLIILYVYIRIQNNSWYITRFRVILYGPTDVGVKMGKIPGVIKGRFYVITSLSDSWEAFTPPHAGVTLGRFLRQLVVAFFSPTCIERTICGKILHQLAYSRKIFPYI